MYSADLLLLHCNCSKELLAWVCMLVPALVVNASVHARTTSKTWLLLCECDQMFVCYSNLHIVVLMSGCMVLWTPLNQNPCWQGNAVHRCFIRTRHTVEMSSCLNVFSGSQMLQGLKFAPIYESDKSLTNDLLDSRYCKWWENPFCYDPLRCILRASGRSVFVCTST